MALSIRRNSLKKFGLQMTWVLAFLVISFKNLGRLYCLKFGSKLLDVFSFVFVSTALNTSDVDFENFEGK